MIFNLGGTKGAEGLETHINNSKIHVTESEKTAWTNKAEKGHKHTKSDITDFPSQMPPTQHSHSISDITNFPSTMPPSNHNQSANTITDGTLAGAVVANAAAVANIGAKQVRNIYGGTAELTDGVSALPTGDIYVQYE